MSTIWIDKDTKLRVNIHAPYKGFSKLDTPEIRERAGVVEEPDPLPPEGIRAEFEAHPDRYTVDETKDNAPPYKLWTRKSDEQIAQITATKLASKVEQLWAAADSYVSGSISGVAVGLLTLGVLQNKPKAMAVTAWTQQVWTEYYTRKALVVAGGEVDTDFTAVGPMPHSVPELQAELGM